LINGAVGRNMDVVMGGGYREFLPNNASDRYGRRGRRTDNKDLIRDWIFRDNPRHPRASAFVYNRVRESHGIQINN